MVLIAALANLWDKSRLGAGTKTFEENLQRPLVCRAGSRSALTYLSMRDGPDT